MEIQELTLYTHRFAEQKTFYCTTLGLPLLHETTYSFAVQAGKTRLCFQESKAPVPPYHVAFTIPHHVFYQTKSQMQRRLPLLYRNGEDEIFFANLNARSFYFCDPADNILEYIAHYNLNDSRDLTDELTPVLHVSEIGLPVEDVPAFAAQLYKQFSLEPYGGSVSESFAFLGDIFGQLVVVSIGRPWLPTETVQATVVPVRLTMRGSSQQEVQFSPYPYTLGTTFS